jgi:tetratricopeptide (TPR) repeat protein
MNCPECQTRNPIGSRFCRLCGTALAIQAGSLAEEEARQAELERAREQGAELLARAHKHLERHEADAAVPLVEEAVRLLPDSTAAHSLLALAYERAHRNDDAIRAMEKVVELNPDSQVDRDKLDRLRRGVHFVPEIAAEPTEQTDWRRWLPWAAGVGAMVLVVGAGTLLSRPSRPVPGVSRPVANPANPNGVPTTGQPVVNPTNTALLPTAPLNYSDPFLPQNPNQTPPQAPPPTTPPPQPTGAANGIPATPPVAGSALPGLGSSPGANANDANIRSVPPVVISPQGSTNRIPRETIDATPPPAGAPGSAISAGPPAGGSGETTAAAPPTQRGYIRIEFNDKDKNSGSDSRAENVSPTPKAGGPRPDTGGDPMLKAQALQSAGKWSEAIAWFRNAQFAGADTGECQQGIALCHQRLGEWDNARASYKRALDAYAKHRGTPRWRTAERGWNACRAALEVLGE